jgi:Arc/MetJ family transcription regulator
MSTEARTRPRKGATKNPNAGGSVAVAALRMEALCAWAIERAEGFPRKVKFSLGDRFIDANLLVVERLVEAAYLRDKRAVLQAASRALVRARVLARLCQRLRALSNDQLHYFEGESVEALLLAALREGIRAHD